MNKTTNPLIDAADTLSAARRICEAIALLDTARKGEAQ